MMVEILENMPRGLYPKGKYIEPFLGGGSVFFNFSPSRAILSDLNGELINLYEGIRDSPESLWEIFEEFPSTKEGYYQIRNLNLDSMDKLFLAARTLYLNRTCFKGMWRHNSIGKFNVGYGGQSRRWVVSEDSLIETSLLLRHARLKCSDFQPIIESAGPKDFLFLDPPYKPGERELLNTHYLSNRFSFEEHKRLASTLERVSKRGIKWAMTITSHQDILDLYSGTPDIRVIPIKKGTGRAPGAVSRNPSEVFICNYEVNGVER